MRQWFDLVLLCGVHVCSVTVYRKRGPFILTDDEEEVTVKVGLNRRGWRISLIMFNQDDGLSWIKVCLVIKEFEREFNRAYSNLNIIRIVFREN